MPGSTFNLAQIQEDVRSDKPETRGKAVQELLLRAQKDAGIYAEALPIFRKALETEQDTWVTLNAVRGIELISGPDEARGIRLSLFNHSRPEVVASLVSAITDPSYTPAVMELLARRPETNIRIAAIHMLGRSRNGAALAAMVSYRDVPALRPHVVDALGDLQDPRAIPYLEPLLNDKTPAWEEDNHGPMLRVCDLAKKAVARLNGQKPAQPPQIPGMMRLRDAQGRQVEISRETWRTSVLPANLKKAWNSPDQLFGIIFSAINDGFRAEIVDAARRLCEIDTDRVRGCSLWAIILIEEGRLDEAEHVLRAFIESHGENGVIVTNLGKVYLRRKDLVKAEELLWHGLELSPNQENGVKLYESLHREQQGKEDGLAALRRIVGLQGSWRAQLWLAREALGSHQVEQALSLYRESLANCPKPVATDLLIEMSGDLGNNGRGAELIALTEPVYDVRVHGVEVGNNLIKAHIDLGELDAARRLIDQLTAMKRPDWQQTLGYWSAQIAKIGGHAIPPKRTSSPQVNSQTVMTCLPVVTTSAWVRIAPFAPLLAAVFEIGWVIVVVMSQLGMGTLSTQDNSHTRSLDIVCMIPALAGLAIGILVVARGLVHRGLEWVFLVIGCLACGFAVFAFGWELFT